MSTTPGCKSRLHRPGSANVSGTRRSHCRDRSADGAKATNGKDLWLSHFVRGQLRLTAAVAALPARTLRPVRKP